MRRLNDLLSDAIGQPEALRLAKAQAAMRKWDQVVGPLLSAHSWPDKYREGIVYVAVSGSAWAQELRMHVGTILGRLNGFASNRGQPLFKQVRFGIRKLPSSGPIPPPTLVKSEPRPVLTPKEIAEKWFGKEPKSGS